MKKQTKTILLAIAGVIGVLCVILIATAVFFFRSMINDSQTDQSGADVAFMDALTPFEGQLPIIEIRRGEAVLTRNIPSLRPAEAVTTLHGLIWEPGGESLSRIRVPMWVVRMVDDPIAMQVGDNIAVESGVELRPEDIDRFGPALLLDHMEADGARVMLWTQ
jgi:hypothetical protein